MDNMLQGELEIAKQQLELFKQQDRLLEKIEMNLYEMKRIAQYAAEHKLTLEESLRQNNQLMKHQAAIRELDKKYGELAVRSRCELHLQ